MGLKTFADLDYNAPSMFYFYINLFFFRTTDLSLYSVKIAWATSIRGQSLTDIDRDGVSSTKLKLYSTEFDSHVHTLCIIITYMLRIYIQYEMSLK